MGGTFAHFFKPNHGVFVWTAWPKKMTNSRDGGWACLEVDIDTCSGAPRAKRASGALWVNKSTLPRKLGNHVTERPSDRATVRLHHRHTNVYSQSLSSYFGSPGESWLHVNVVINWQLSKQGIRWPVSPDRIAGSGVDPSRSSVFWSYPLTI